MKPAIIDIKGIGPAAVETRAAMVISQAADLLAAPGITQSVDDSDQQHGKKDKKKDKKKKGKGKGKK